MRVFYVSLAIGAALPAAAEVPVITPSWEPVRVFDEVEIPSGTRDLTVGGFDFDDQGNLVLLDPYVGNLRRYSPQDDFATWSAVDVERALISVGGPD